MGFIGTRFTWDRQVQGGCWVWERLDRVVASSAWLELFPSTKVLNTPAASSKHLAMIIPRKGLNIEMGQVSGEIVRI